MMNAVFAYLFEMKHHSTTNIILILFAFLLFMACNGQKNDLDLIKVYIFDEFNQPNTARVQITSVGHQYLAPGGHTHDSDDNIR